MKKNIKEGMEGKAVDWYSDVFDTIFPGVDAEVANSMWKDVLKKPKKGEEAKDEDD
jgi:Lon-like ATP-dependent protease